MADWDMLPETLKNSNLQQADDIERKLRAIGCTMREVTDREIARMTFTKQEIETMAEMEHARWNLERLLDGWTFGNEKDLDKKTSPYLVSWSELPDDVNKWDRDAVAAIPELLANVGLEICRVP